MPRKPRRTTGISARPVPHPRSITNFSAYERRLPAYPSGRPVQFAIETAGGRLREVGLGVGDVVPLDVESLVGRAR